MALSQQVQSKDVAKSNSNSRSFLIVPSSFEQLERYAGLIAKSAFCPKDYKGKPGDILIAVQMGAEVGLSPLQALQNIAVINGRPCIWGDAALGIVMTSASYVSHREWYTGDIKTNDLTAHCAIIRKNSDEYIKSFSMDDAKKANLWGKSGPWSQYPTRMLQMRARSFCVRDKFADALKGLNIREEVEDYDNEQKKGRVINITNAQPSQPSQQVNVSGYISAAEYDIESMLLDLSQTNSLDALQKVYVEHYKTLVKNNDKSSLEKLMSAKDNKKSQLDNKDFLDAYDGKKSDVKQEEVGNNESL